MKLASNILLKVGGLLAFTTSGVMLFGSIDGWDRPSAEDVVTVRDEPHRVRPIVQPLFSSGSPETCLVSSLLKQSASFPRVGSALCHLLRVYGLEPMSHPHFLSGMEVVRVLTNQEFAEKYLGQPVLFQTRHGVRYRLPLPTGPGNQDGESHRDLFLAAFAELGLSLSTPMETATGSFTLRDLLKDSVAHFDLKQQEIAWTAIAYSLFLSQRKEWRNRDGESFTFDDLANELLRRPLHDAPCGGIHLLYAMTMLARVDSASLCLSASVREVVLRHLQEYVLAAVASQANEGYWTSGWDQTSPVRDTPFIRLLITGHIVEWMEYLPRDLQPSAEVYRRAAGWLCSELRRNPLEPSEFCPWTHAICSVRNLVGDADEPVTKDGELYPASF